MDVQDEIRQELTERKYARVSADYVLKLAENATVSAIDPFVAAATQRAEQHGAHAAAGAGKE